MKCKWCERRAIRDQFCSTCLYFYSVMQREERTIVNHISYKVGPNLQHGYGESGEKFEIQYFDGREVITHNLWCQGEVPSYLWEKLPDNARFIYRINLERFLFTSAMSEI